MATVPQPSEHFGRESRYAPAATAKGESTVLLSGVEDRFAMILTGDLRQ